MRNRDDVTIEQTDQGFFGVLTKEGQTFREPLPENLTDYTPEKQAYWMRRCIVALDRQFKEHLRTRGLVEA